MRKLVNNATSGYTSNEERWKSEPCFSQSHGLWMAPEIVHTLLVFSIIDEIKNASSSCSLHKALTQHVVLFLTVLKWKTSWIAGDNFRCILYSFVITLCCIKLR